MAGSSKTGDDMEAGRVNRAEDSTFHQAQQRSEEGGFFNGTAILVVEPADGDFEDGFRAIGGKSIDGIKATGLQGGAGIIGMAEGELSAADRDHATGAGVFGKGRGGGIVGQGVSQPGVASGAGVIGRGSPPAPAGGVVTPGVVGFAGDIKSALPGSPDEDEEAKAIFPPSTGVFGLGGIGVIGQGISDHKVFLTKDVGFVSGAGVQGTGDGGAAGVDGIGGTGVIGRSAAGEGLPVPLGGDPSETGVYGIGQDGILGVGRDGRGGIFVSKSSAQVQLVPAKDRLAPAPGHHAVDTQSFTPERVTNPLPALPKTANGGDLMALEDNLKQCTLWLCVQGGEGTDTSKAIWAQILLGPTFDGAT